jgi:hypothetical protein
MGCQSNVFKSIANPSTYPICGVSLETIDSKSQTVCVDFQQCPMQRYKKKKQMKILCVHYPKSFCFLEEMYTHHLAPLLWNSPFLYDILTLMTLYSHITNHLQSVKHVFAITDFETEGNKCLSSLWIQLDQMTVKMWLLACSLFFTSKLTCCASKKRKEKKA